MARVESENWRENATRREAARLGAFEVDNVRESIIGANVGLDRCLSTVIERVDTLHTAAADLKLHTDIFEARI